MAKRTDANQQEIMDALRDVWCRVLDLSMVGRDCPDVLVLFRGRLTLLEIKTRLGRLSPGQVEFMRKWREDGRGPVYVVRSIEDAYRAVGVEVE